MNTSLISAIPLLGFLMLTSCATVKVDKDRVGSVKRVAIVGFDVQQQKPVSTMDLVKVATKQDTTSKAEVALASEAAHVGKMYDLLQKKLEQENSWKVLPLEVVRKNPVYGLHFKEKTEGFQTRPMINDRYTLMQPSNILDSFAIYSTRPEKLKEIQEALGVDALLIVSISVALNNNSALLSLVGQGKFAPIATTTLQLLDARTNSRLWQESQAVGEPAENNEKNFLGMADDEKLNQLAFVAAQKSYVSLLSRYKETLSK